MSHGGGLNEPRLPTRHDQKILDQVKPQFERTCEINTSKFKADLVRTQVVAGTVYFFKVEIEDGKFVHLKVFQPLPHENKGPTLLDYQMNMKKEDKLDYF
ncbi:cystatin-B-like isoform X2 [Pyxicephalus adspersus]|uniref:cystatin-B-like isoform X2 n=1 Tax=Pyxicephalus adspersus TaxID=30357 RepID=UPI003B5CC4B2